jgi:hypothetical protein
MPCTRSPTPRWRKARPHRAETFERVLSPLIVPKFYPRWANHGEEGEDDTYDRFIVDGREVLGKGGWRP